MENERGEPRTFGRHEAWAEEPDVFFMRVNGPIDAEELRAMFDFQIDWGMGKEGYYVLCDLTALGDVSKGAREVLKEGRVYTHKNVRGICFGASFTIRVLVDMVTRAIRILRWSSKGRGDVVFTATEAEARELVRKWRASSAT